MRAGERTRFEPVVKTAFVLAAALAFPLFYQLAGGQGNSETGKLRFRDIANEAGIHFVYENSRTPQKYLIETMPGGVAAFDYNNDGRTDVFFTNGAAIPSLDKNDPKYANRLFRNDGGLRFTDVTDAAGVRGHGYSASASVADFDNDGDQDLFVGGVHHQALYRNRGDGTFEDITDKAGLQSAQWTVGAGWFDYDNDGRLDLLVVNYTVWSTGLDRFCGDSSRNVRAYCHPKWFEPVSVSLYRNRGDGTFADVTSAAGIAGHKGRGMGIAFADYDRDGWLDFYITNDKLPSFLFHNLKNGKFEEVGLMAGVSLPQHGQEISAMAAEFRDYDNDSWPDIHVTALAGETFPLYRNEANGSFVDVTYRSRLGGYVVRRSGWSNGFFDFDNDGWKDLFTANSHVNDMIEHFESAAYLLPNSVFRNLGNGTFADSSTESGLAAGPARAHRGAGYADFDDDGRVDMVVSALNDAAELWHNESSGSGHWLDIRLVGKRSNRDGIGAVVQISASADPRWKKQWNHMTTAVGYASSSNAGIHFGTGAAAIIDRLEIRWPGGTIQVLTDVACDRTLRLEETP